MNYKHFSKRNNFTRKIMGGTLFSKLRSRFGRRRIGRREVAELTDDSAQQSVRSPVINPRDDSAQQSVRSPIINPPDDSAQQSVRSPIINPPDDSAQQSVRLPIINPQEVAIGYPIINPQDVSTPLVMDLSPEELDIYNKYIADAENILYYTNNGENELYWPTIANVRAEFYNNIRRFRDYDDISKLRDALQDTLDLLEMRLKFNNDITKTIPIDVRPSNTAELLDTPIPDYVEAVAHRTPGQGIVVPVRGSLQDWTVWLDANLPY